MINRLNLPRRLINWRSDWIFRACSLCQQRSYLSHPSDHGVHL